LAVVGYGFTTSRTWIDEKVLSERLATFNWVDFSNMVIQESLLLKERLRIVMSLSVGSRATKAVQVDLEGIGDITSRGN
jgi:hypothetical protein